MPFFFLQQIEVTGKGVALNNEPVTWSLKRFSTQKECTCYIQIYKDKKEKLYLITNLKNLKHMLKNTIMLRTDKISPSERRENQLIDILDALKKDTEFNFFTKKFICQSLLQYLWQFYQLLLVNVSLIYYERNNFNVCTDHLPTRRRAMLASKIRPSRNCDG